MALPMALLYFIASGLTTHYARPGMMQYAAQAQGVIATKPYSCTVALKANYLGSEVYLYFPRKKQWVGPCLVGDYANKKDYKYLDKIGFAVDLSYEAARDLHVLWKREPVMVYLLRRSGGNKDIWNRLSSQGLEPLRPGPTAY